MNIVEEYNDCEGAVDVIDEATNLGSYGIFT
jgi:hypothetical protein